MKTYGQKTLEQAAELCQFLSVTRHSIKGRDQLTREDVESLDYTLEKLEDQAQAIEYRLRKLFRVGEI